MDIENKPVHSLKPLLVGLQNPKEIRQAHPVKPDTDSCRKRTLNPSQIFSHVNDYSSVIDIMPNSRITSS